MKKIYKVYWWSNLRSVAPKVEIVKGEEAKDALIANLKRNPFLTFVVEQIS